MILATHGIVGSSIVQFTGLLDTYSGSAAAYSLRLLSSTYTGDAIRVRNSSNSEADIGFVNNVLDTASLLTHCGGGDGFVKTWYDQSGNGNDASNTTASKQPQIVSNGSVILENGKPSVQFDGTDDGLGLDYSTFDIGSLSSFAIGKYNVLNTRMLFALSGSTGNKRWYAPFSTSSTFRFGYAGNSTATSTTGDTNQHLFTMIAGSTLGNMQSWIDASSIGTATLDSGIDARGGIGNFDGSFNANCKAQEIIIYPSDQSSNRTGIETNINDFYSIY